MISIKFTIDDKLHASPESWRSVKFGKYLDYSEKVGKHEPYELTSFIKDYHELVKDLEKTLTQEEREAEGLRLFHKLWSGMEWRDIAICHHFFALDVAFWCDVDQETIMQLDCKDLESAYWALQVQMNPDNATIDKDYTGFALNSVEYVLPKKHMVGSTVDEFADAAYFQEEMQNVKGGNWAAMLNVMTVICRPKSEKYNDNEAFREKRKELFKELPMSDVINVAFFLLRLNDTLSNNLVIYTAAQEVQQQRQRLLASGTDGLL